MSSELRISPREHSGAAESGKARFVDRTGVEPAGLDDLWEPVVVTREEIEAEVDRLSALPRPGDGRRRSLIVHPRESAGLGLAPGIEVALEVLLPGERTDPIRHNSAQVVFCIEGGGAVVFAGGPRVVRSFERYDVWNTPSMSTYVHVNDTAERQVRLNYSNAALLERLNVHYVDTDPGKNLGASSGSVDEDAAEFPFEELFELGDEGAWLMAYERVIRPPVQESPALMWPWKQVKAELDKLHVLGAKYRGRRLYLLYNPATGRTNGTTHGFFATMTIRPAGVVDRPHRHTAAAINYYFKGSGHSTVAGRRYDWKAGDLMLSAPGWAIHNHASHDSDVYELTIQDSPFHLTNDSLLWQESLRQQPILIGSHSGWATNRASV
ncbi:gentisate 1,2-dioxygenase [Kribbella orskensis]|uniref:Gentisate 1,2-dioxygenase n=1 Tax=Kribbella orskensis TaxID=2512216 RepID=A0ABY2BVN3_9ACTN|nr:MULTISPECIES: AraC family ligand binding domain-containing protein [Kribbella]TCN44186.1 gentisate 1,2-dioxygenase [Kribbella sp. VKM Ac-2500]TCO32036.1 gentisate 1,2-dioxygenase [Kribbella orskensis]